MAGRIYGPKPSFNTGRATTASFVNSEISYMVAVATTEVIKLASAGASVEAQEAIGGLARTYAVAIRQNWRQVIKVHEKVAQEASKAMMRRYTETKKIDDTGPYRANASGAFKRYAGGVLESALASPNMFRTTTDGVIFGNPDWLDSKAKQWARLNFGAGEAAKDRIFAQQAIDAQGADSYYVDVARARVQSPAVKFFAAELGIDLGGPRPSWIMPAGLWTDVDPYGAHISDAVAGSEGGSIFTPLGGFRQGPSKRSGMKQDYSRGNFTRRMTSRGVAARGFLEAGAGSVARNLPIADMSYMLSIFEKATDQAANAIPNKLALPTGQINKTIKLLEAQIAAQIKANPGNVQQGLRQMSTFARGVGG